MITFNSFEQREISRLTFIRFIVITVIGEIEEIFDHLSDVVYLYINAIPGKK